MLLIKNKILFIEIPRTGTTTIRRCCGEQTPIHEERHISISDYLVKNPNHSNLTTCTFVRNPFCRVASLYEHTKQFNPAEPEVESFYSFVEWYVSRPDRREITLDDIRKTQVEMLVIDGKIDISWIGRFENYERDFNALVSNNGINLVRDLEVNNHYKLKQYKEYYNRSTRKTIEKFVEPDLDFFGYKF